MIKNNHILKSEIVVDGTTIIETSRGSVVAGAILGGALFGGVGAIIGCLSAERNASTKVKRIELKIIVDDIKNPVKTIPFLNSNYVISTDSNQYKDNFESS